MVVATCMRRWKMTPEYSEYQSLANGNRITIRHFSHTMELRDETELVMALKVRGR